MAPVSIFELYRFYSAEYTIIRSSSEPFGLISLEKSMTRVALTRDANSGLVKGSTSSTVSPCTAVTFLIATSPVEPLRPPIAILIKTVFDLLILVPS